MGGLRALLICAALVVGACSEGDDASSATDDPITTTVESDPVTVESITNALLSDADGPLRAADPSAGEPEAQCFAERLVEAFDDETLQRIGLPEDLDGVPTLLDDGPALLSFFDATFDCLDMRSFVAEQLPELSEPQRSCVADLVVNDEDVRLLFVLGTTTGSPGPPTGSFEEELARLSQFEADCVTN